MGGTVQGAIASDVVGSPFELDRVRTRTFSLVPKRSEFTDGTVPDVAVVKQFRKSFLPEGRRS